METKIFATTFLLLFSLLLPPSLSFLPHTRHGKRDLAPEVNTNAELREFCQQVERRCLESIYSWRESLKEEKGDQRQFKRGPKIDNKFFSDNNTP
ncbi:hypothetical protein ABFA07_011897 [Porites harrisoni]